MKSVSKCGRRAPIIAGLVLGVLGLGIMRSPIALGEDVAPKTPEPQSQATNVVSPGGDESSEPRKRAEREKLVDDVPTYERIDQIDEKSEGGKSGDGFFDEVEKDLSRLLA